MRSHGTSCLIFGASLSTLVGLIAFPAHAQFATPAPFNHNIWRPAAPLPDSTQVSSASNTGSPQNAALHQAFFQDGLGGYAPNQGVAPASFNQFSNPGGPMTATQVQQPSGAQFRPQNHQSQQAFAPPNGYGQATYQNAAMQQPVYPNGLDPNAAMAPAQLRPSGTGNVPTQPTPQFQQPVVSANDPRFVSPAPRQGTYSTTPYTGPYRTVGYQLPQQSPPVQQVQAPVALANQPQVVPQTTGLPQYQPVVGHLANYQVQQPGYCAPSIPANGVPAFVPGAVAPPTLPPNLAPQLYTPDNAGFRPLFSLGQENYNVQLGRGIIGQPTAYVAGQPIRNFLRYLAP